MPPVRSVQIHSTGCTLQSLDGVRTLRYQSVPSTLTTPTRAEAFMNAWASSNSSGYQVRFHVFQRTPLVVTVGTWNAGEAISTTWWQDA